MASNYVQDIVIKTKFLEDVKGFEKTIAKLEEMRDSGLITNTQFKQFTKTMGNLGGDTAKGAKKHAIYTQNLKQQQKELKKNEFYMKNLGKALGSFSVTLPLLFGFQQIGQAMKSLVDPAMELVGVTELYNEFLALKYLPTALEQLDNVIALGEEWGNQSEEQRKMEGDMILFTNRMAELVSYTAQLSTMFAAIGEALPTIDLTPFGIGIELTGRSAGAAFGAVLGLTSGIWALGDQTANTVVTMSGMEAAVGVRLTDALSRFLTTAKDSFGITQKEVVDTQEEVDELKKKIDDLPAEKTIEITIDVKNKDVLDQISKLIGGAEKKTMEGVITAGAGRMPSKNEIILKPGEATPEALAGYARKGLDVYVPEVGIVSKAPPKAKSNILSAGLGSSVIGKLLGGLLGFENGGVVPGPIGTPTPIIAHGGERVIPVGGSSGREITMNVTYNVTVSDKREFESMLRENNIKLTEDVRRTIKA